MRFILLLALAGCAAEYDLVAPVDVHPEEITECEFEPVDGVKELQRYSCNPVFTSSDESWVDTLGSLSFNHTMVMGHPFYQLWYVGRTGNQAGEFSVGYAASTNGTDWQSHPSNPGWPTPDTSKWDGGSIQLINVAGDPNTGGYLMLYGGISRAEDFFGIGVAGSRDGLEWELLPQNPVFDLDLRYDGVDFSWPLDLKISEDYLYEAFLAGGKDEEALDLYRIQTRQADNWSEKPERVMRAGEAGAWDDEGFLDAAIVDFDGTQYMFYTGFGSWVEDGNIRYTQEAFLGLATSTDGGNTWKRETKNKPLGLHLEPSGSVTMVAARRVGTRIHLWVSDWYPELEETGVGFFVYEPPL